MRRFNPDCKPFALACPTWESLNEGAMLVTHHPASLLAVRYHDRPQHVKETRG